MYTSFSHPYARNPVGLTHRLSSIKASASHSKQDRLCQPFERRSRAAFMFLRSFSTCSNARLNPSSCMLSRTADVLRAVHWSSQSAGCIS